MPLAPTPGELSASVLVILDPYFGDQFRQTWQPGRPSWVAMSPGNEATVRSLWAAHPDVDHLSGITSFDFDPKAVPEVGLPDYLDTIDLHHGRYACKNSYTELEVIGAGLTTEVREALGDLGFAEFSARACGFVARRSQEEAVRERD